MYYLCIVKQLKLVFMIFLRVSKCSKLRLNLRLFDENGVGSSVSFRFSHGEVTCVEYPYSELESLSISNGLLRAYHYSDSWRIEFLHTNGSVCLLDFDF